MKTKTPELPKLVKIRGWTFERFPNGMVGLSKESLVHDDLLLGEEEWDNVVSTLWQPCQEDADDEDADDLER